MEDEKSNKPNMFRVRSKLEEEDKERLEGDYGVRIAPDSLTVTCNIVRRHFDDEEKSVEAREVLLRTRAVDLLGEACATLGTQLYDETSEDDEDERSLDADEFALLRSFVEIGELRKEMNPAREAWLDHLNQELRDAMDKWDRYFDKWKPLLKRNSKRWAKEIKLLQEVRQDLCSLDHGGFIHSNRWNEMIRQLDVLATRGNCKKFQQVVTVGPHLIAKVASSVTGVPESWLLRSSKPPLDDLMKRLSRRQFGKGLSILTISHALSRVAGLAPAERETRPIGSFLFLCGNRHDGPELAEALADELFGGQGSLINFDLSEYTDSHSVSRLLGLPTIEGDLGSSGLLTEAVKRKPYSVVLLSNIDVAHVSVIDIVTEISSCGRLTDGQGSTIDFTKTVIIMTSTIGTDKPVVSLTCKCFEMVRESPLKALLACHPEESRHRCNILPRLEKVQKQLKDELFKQLDDIVVFSSLQIQHFKSIARLQLRKTASSMTRRGVIIYPSEAALDCILWTAYWWTGGEKLVKDWLEKNLNPVLHDMCEKGEIEDNSIIYIDTLVGTEELSYRVVNHKDFVVGQALKLVKESSAELRVLCRKGKERIKRIYLLRRRLFESYSSVSVDAGTDFGCVDRAIEELVAIIDLMINEIDANHVADKEKVVQSGMNEAAEVSLGEGSNKRTKKGVEFLEAKLRSRVWEQATDIVARVALRIADAPQYPPRRAVVSFLFLGLTTSGKGKLVKDLAEHFVTEDGADLLIRIDLSEYSDSNSLSRLTDALSRYMYSEHCEGELFPDDVRLRPCSILYLDQIEKAHVSVFSALISVLDQSMFIDHQGRTVGFRDTIVIIVSDVGNKEIFAHLTGHTSQNIKCDGDIKKEVKGFRCELLNRVWEIVFLDPFAAPDDQLRKVARLSMWGAGRILGGWLTDDDFHRTLLSLFEPDIDPDPCESKSEAVERVVRCLSKGLIEHDGGSSGAAVQ